MAKPIPMEIPPRDARAELLSRLENAPAEHAEALLAGYEVLQGLHDSGTLELLRGLLGSGDRVLQTAVDATRASGSVRIIRNLLSLTKMLGEFDPDLLEGFVRALPEAMKSAQAKAQDSPGLLSTLNEFRNKDLLRGIVVVNRVLEIWGREYLSAANPQSKK